MSSAHLSGMKLGALALLFVAACASSPEPVVLEWHGSEAGYAMAQEAASEWFTVCHAAIFVGRHGGAPLEEVHGGLEGGHLGVTSFDPSTGSVAWMQVQVYADERTTLAHEMGHALGLEHKSSGVMAVQAVRGPGLFHVTPADCP